MTQPIERRVRWAISFADLALLLLGFFVLLQASGQKSRAVIAGVGAQFGAQPMRAEAELKAADIFVPGEAMLTPSGAARIAILGRRFAVGGNVELASVGQDRGTQRFDSWDLAAARLGAVARSLKNSGIPQRKLVIRGLDQAADHGRGQIIRIGPGALAR